MKNKTPLFRKTPIIKAKAFTLRPPRLNDVSDLVRILNDPQISRFMSRLPYPYRQSDALEFIKKSQKFQRGVSEFAWVFAIEKDQQLIGMVSLRKIIPGHKAEIGYWLSRAYWGQGIMTAAVKIITRLAVSEFKICRLAAHVYKANPASRRVLEKNGFKVEGLLRKGLKKKGRFIDVYQLAKVK